MQAKNEKLNRISLRKRKPLKRNEFYDDDEEDTSQLFEKYDTESDDDASCIYCEELFSKSRPKEFWVRCQRCSKWSHTLCAGVSNKVKQFTCELCTD